MTVVSLLIVLAAMPQEKVSPEFVAVQTWLTDHCGMQRPSDLMQEISTPVMVSKLKTGACFVHYREFPVAFAPNPPLVQRNVFLVRNGKAEHFKSREAMRKSFVAGLPPVAEQDLTAICTEYAFASAHFSQDGMFQFVVDPKRFTAKKLNGDQAIVTATIPVVEKGGDKGKLVDVFTFTKVGTKFQLKSVDEKDTIQPGIRPVCQCTLLLDKNPIVRKIAERDLLVMGKDAFPYMREQMAIASPELKIEIERVWKRIERGER